VRDSSPNRAASGSSPGIYARVDWLSRAGTSLALGDGSESLPLLTTATRWARG